VSSDFSRSSKVVDFGICRNILLIINSNVGPVLLRFGDIADFVLKGHPTRIYIYLAKFEGVSLNWTRSPMLGLRRAKTLS